MLNIIMVVPDTLSSNEAKNAPDWNAQTTNEQAVSAAKKRIQTTQRMNRSSDVQIVKSKELMSKGVRRSKNCKEVPELA